MSQTPNTAIAVIGIDVGKNSFHVVGHDARGAIVLQQPGRHVLMLSSSDFDPEADIRKQSSHPLGGPHILVCKETADSGSLALKRQSLKNLFAQAGVEQI